MSRRNAVRIEPAVVIGWRCDLLEHPFPTL
jgi:hypothetical protein